MSSTGFTQRIYAIQESSTKIHIALPDGYRLGQSLSRVTLTFKDDKGRSHQEEVLIATPLAPSGCVSLNANSTQETKKDRRYVAPSSRPASAFSVPNDLATHNPWSISFPPSLAPETPAKKSATIVRDLLYYFEMISIQVGTTLFRVPKHNIQPLLWAFAGGIYNGIEMFQKGSDTEPFVLEGVQKSDFAVLLKLLYPLSPKSTPDTLTTEEWISILKVTSQTSFLLRAPHNEPRRMAMEYLAKKGLPSARYVALGREFSIPGWVKPCIKKIIESQAPITAELVESVGFRTVESICRIQESIYGPLPSCGFPVKQEAVQLPIIDQVFKHDLKEQDTPSSNGSEIINRVILASRSKQSTWLRLALAEVVARNGILTAEEAGRLPSKDLAAKIWQARLEFRRRNVVGRALIPVRLTVDETTFEKEFRYEEAFELRPFTPEMAQYPSS